MPIAAFSLSLLLLASGASAHTTEESSMETDTPAWLNEVLTYGMLPLPPETAKQFHVRVNGAWAGFGGTSPILPFTPYTSEVDAQFGQDVKAYVDACHDAGLLVCAAINGTEGFPGLREIVPDLESMACRDGDGNLAMHDNEAILMCANNPRWLQWEIDYGKQGIDFGADLVLVDTPQSTAYAAALKNGGFCEYCMRHFESYLRAKYTPEELQERFGLSEFVVPEIISRLRAPKNPQGDELLYVKRAAKNPLFHEFLLCQERASFDTRKALIDALRAYAKSKDRDVAFWTNAFHLGSINPYGYWLRALMFADVFDIFAYESSYSPNGTPAENERLPRGKWAAYHKLSHAVHHRRSPSVIAVGSLVPLIAEASAGKTRNAWMGVQTAEAYAANGANMIYYFESPPGDKSMRDRLWRDAVDVAGFVERHKDLYEGQLKSGSKLAILFLMNDRGRTIPAVYPSYLGFAQALVEQNYPFDVLFAGDGDYVKDKLTAADLEDYQCLLVPSPIAPTENQKQVIQAFVNTGGTLICQEPAKLGFTGTPAEGSLPSCLDKQMTMGTGTVMVLRGKVTDTWTDDIGSNFYRSYDGALREDIGRLASALNLVPVVEASDGLIAAFPMLQPERNRVVTHLINYDVDYENDAVREKKGITVRIPIPPFIAGDVECALFAPGSDEALPLQATVDEGHVACTVPSLGLAASLVVSGSGPTPGS